MTLTHQHRRTIHHKLSPIIGEEEADALLAQFPTSPADAPATRDDLRVTAADLRGEITELRGEMHREIGTLRSEVHREIGLLRRDMGLLRADMEAGVRRMIQWGTGALLGGLGVGMALAALIARGG